MLIFIFRMEKFVVSVFFSVVLFIVKIDFKLVLIVMFLMGGLLLS